MDINESVSRTPTHDQKLIPGWLLVLPSMLITAAVLSRVSNPTFKRPWNLPKLFVIQFCSEQSDF